jgi:hypothetical protein
MRKRTFRRRAAGSTWIALAGVSGCMPSQDLDGYGASARRGDEPVTTDMSIDRVESPGAVEPSDPPRLSSETPPFMPGAPVSDPALGSTAGSGGAAASGAASALSDAGLVEPSIDAAAPAPCGSGELFGPDGACYAIENALLTWDAARALCRERGPGWDLASIQSVAESEFLAASIGVETWIGATDAAREGIWRWIAADVIFWLGSSALGVPAAGAYANWNTSEPNGADATNCARALPDAFGSPTPNAPWADLACATALASICEEHLADR